MTLEVQELVKYKKKKMCVFARVFEGPFSRIRSQMSFPNACSYLGRSLEPTEVKDKQDLGDFSSSSRVYSSSILRNFQLYFRRLLGLKSDRDKLESRPTSTREK